MAPLVLASLVLVLTLVLWSWFYWSSRRRLWQIARVIPGPTPWPIVGNAPLFWGSLGDSFQLMTKMFSQYGPVVKLWLGDRLTVLLCDPDDAQTVLGNQKIRNRDDILSRAMIPFFGNGLLSNRDEVWKKHRKIITPALHFKVLETYVEIFGQKTEVLLNRLDEVADGQSFDICKRFLTLCTLDAICETAIGGNMDAQEKGHSDFESVMADAIVYIHDRVLKPWLRIEWLYPWTAEGKKAFPAIKKIKSFSERVIAEKLAEYRAGVRRPGITTASGKKVTSFLDMLVEASESQGSLLSAQEIQDEVTTLAASGFETTANTMSFVLLLLAIHPEIQEQVYEELIGLFGDDPRMATVDDIQKVPVLERVIKETLRMFPGVPIMPREIDEDIALPSGYILPKGCTTWIIAFFQHRNKHSFPNPDKFLPDRWLEENPNRHPYAYIPFSAGPRNCVGQKYAMMQMKTMLSGLLRRFKFHTQYTVDEIVSNLQISITINLPPGLYLVQLERR